MEGAREAKTPNKKKTGLWIAVGAVLLLAAVYLGLCIYVQTADRILPNTRAAGLDVSGMTEAEAADALRRMAEEESGSLTVELTCRDWRGQLPASRLEPDWDAAAESAFDADRTSFLTLGAQFLRRLAGKWADVGLPVPADQPALVSQLDECARTLERPLSQPSWKVEEDRLILTKGTSALSLETSDAAEKILAAFDRLYIRRLAEGESGPLTETVELKIRETPCEEPDLEQIHREVYQPPKDSVLDPETLQATDHVVGVNFSVRDLSDRFLRASDGERISFPLTLTQPRETKESLSGKLFRDVLGKATSRVKGTANRRSNVKRAAASCNGVVLLPGDVFSYNDSVGSITAERGYLPAPVYAGGASVDGVGGGICQPSSTIYYALLHSTLEVVERRNHMYAVGYVPDGMDATVFHGSTDFRFRNNTDYPVRIVTESYKKGGAFYLTVTLLGTNTTGRYAVPKASVTDWVEPTDKYVPDPAIPRGTTVIDREQNPYRGRRAAVTRSVYDADGNLIETQNMGLSRYKMRPKTIYYNPLDGDPLTWENGVPPAPPVPPADPVSPTDPAAPADPAVPADPSGPSDPAVPSDPAAPETPPVCPILPVYPLVP